MKNFSMHKIFSPFNRMQNNNILTGKKNYVLFESLDLNPITVKFVLYPQLNFNTTKYYIFLDIHTQNLGL
jgi:hypothetical protein